MIFEVYIIIFVWAILEIAFLPFPTEVLIIPLVASQHVNPLAVAVVGTLGSTLGGLLDYALGRVAFDFMDSRLKISNRIDRYQKRFPRIAKYGLPALLVFGGVFPLGTMKPFMLLAGASRYDLRMFCVLVGGSSFVRLIVAATIGSTIGWMGQFVKL